jgi:23S rRNA pseudouridine1911/1915/1917 synthase
VIIPKEIECCLLDEFPSRSEGIRFLLGCSKAQLKKAELPKKWLELPNKKGETWRLPVDLVNHGKIAPFYHGPSSMVINESKNFLAIHKPAQIHSHPLCYTDTNTALNALYELNRAELLEINTSHYDRSLLYRLDFETSGVVIFAKSELAYQEVRENFNELAKEKIYLAIVHGKIEKQGKFTHYFKSSGPGGERQKVFESGDGHQGILELTVLEYSTEKNLSLVKVKLQTGLRHQIRAQLSYLGHPLLGDEFYGGEKSERLYLHAYQYTLNAMNETFTAIDTKAELFDSFFDLNSAFKMI